VLHVKSNLWQAGYAVSMYSRSYDVITREQDFTDLGRAIHQFKYWKLPPQDRDRIQNFCVVQLQKALLEAFGVELPFNYVVAVPPNRKDSHSLPPLLASDLAGRSKGKLESVNKLLYKKKELPSMKNLSTEEKAKALSDAYGFKTNLPEPQRGILIIDDIYDSGTTLRFVARAIRDSYPNLPRFVLTLTALKSNY
jgi:predicted amidophosphoribosyltransferase